jgi:dihydrofolate reductase
MDLFFHPFDLLLGRHTYDIWAGFWPQEGIKSPDNPIASKFNSATKYVATHRPDTLNWQTSHALKGELAEAVRALKHTDGPNLLTWGSSNMLHQLFAAGLVDELLLLIYPVVIGSGKRLFDDNAQVTTFTLAHSVGSRGVVIARYVRKGELRPRGWYEGK